MEVQAVREGMVTHHPGRESDLLLWLLQLWLASVVAAFLAGEQNLMGGKIQERIGTRQPSELSSSSETKPLIAVRKARHHTVPGLL